MKTFKEFVEVAQETLNEAIAKPDNIHWAAAVQKAKAHKKAGGKVGGLWNTHQNVRNRHMAQLARDAGFEPTAEMNKEELKHK
jgi:hypothetical protein